MAQHRAQPVRLHDYAALTTWAGSHVARVVAMLAGAGSIAAGTFELVSVGFMGMELFLVLIGLTLVVLAVRAPDRDVLRSQR